MNLRQYIAESEKKFSYRIKSVADLPSGFEQIKRFLQRYNLIDIKKPKKTIMQKNPLDFESVPNAEVYIMDVTLGLPISSYVIQRELVGVLGLPGDYLVVRGENDPVEQQVIAGDQSADIKKQAEKKDLSPAALLGTDSQYPEAEQTADGSNYYGNSYNSRLLDYLEKQSQERVEAMKVDAPAPLFKWLDMPKPEVDSDFNRDIKNPTILPKETDAKVPTPTGNFDDEGKVMKKTYVDSKGATKTLTAKPNSIRKD